MTVLQSSRRSGSLSQAILSSRVGPGQIGRAGVLFGVGVGVIGAEQPLPMMPQPAQDERVVAAEEQRLEPLDFLEQPCEVGEDEALPQILAGIGAEDAPPWMARASL
jgi:hypothetical protein